MSLVVIGIALWAFFRFTGEKSLKLVSPNGKEVWRAGETYQISWKAKNIGKVGIVLIKGEGKDKKEEWIAKDISAGQRKYDWKIFVWQAPGQDYKIGIFEYPWKEGNKIDYSDETFTIIGPQFASCDSLSIENEWPFLPSDFPNLRKVFITRDSWQGNLGGLEGADEKCQQEAEKNGFAGKWKALLGDDNTLAVDRLDLNGIFVEARPAAILPEGKTCHRLLGKNFDLFFEKLSEPLLVSKEKFERDFLKNLSELWLGRINKESKKNCTTIYSQFPPPDLSKRYSFTTTCQNWTTELKIIPGYPPPPGEKKEFPICYTPEGATIQAVGSAGLSSGLIEEEKYLSPFLAKPCDSFQHLLCIQQ